MQLPTYHVHHIHPFTTHVQDHAPLIPLSVSLSPSRSKIMHLSVLFLSNYLVILLTSPRSAQGSALPTRGGSKSALRRSLDTTWHVSVPGHRRPVQPGAGRPPFSDWIRLPSPLSPPPAHAWQDKVKHSTLRLLHTAPNTQSVRTRKASRLRFAILYCSVQCTAGCTRQFRPSTVVQYYIALGTSQ